MSSSDQKEEISLLCKFCSERNQRINHRSGSREQFCFRINVASFNSSSGDKNSKKCVFVPPKWVIVSLEKF
jgi:hypothetical protein